MSVDCEFREIPWKKGGVKGNDGYWSSGHSVFHICTWILCFRMMDYHLDWLPNPRSPTNSSCSLTNPSKALLSNTYLTYFDPTPHPGICDPVSGVCSPSPTPDCGILETEPLACGPRPLECTSNGDSQCHIPSDIKKTTQNSSFCKCIIPDLSLSLSLSP